MLHQHGCHGQEEATETRAFWTMRGRDTRTHTTEEGCQILKKRTAAARSPRKPYMKSSKWELSVDWYEDALSSSRRSA